MTIDFNLFREDFMKQKYGVQLKGRLMRLHRKKFLCIRDSLIILELKM